MKVKDTNSIQMQHHNGHQVIKKWPMLCAFPAHHKTWHLISNTKILYALSWSVSSIKQSNAYQIIIVSCESSFVLHCISCLLQPGINTESQDGRIHNSHLIVNCEGDLVGHYSKTHLFDVEIKDRVRLKESDSTYPGQKIVPPVATPVGKVGLSIVSLPQSFACEKLTFVWSTLAIQHASLH